MVYLALIGYLTIGFLVGAWLRAWAANRPDIDADVEFIGKVCILVWPALMLFLLFVVGSGLVSDLQAAVAKKWERKE